ncbi:hypothetical protein O6H91_06G125700 [Diphasiastrum complanatum]|uniref:Uncharacterized protein n=2 Tax=Diphasiastrum complanatum TaxID=34168 RepID=A0ACC2DJG9_DIPCM|nr:hypothetical protein O6H91_06G125100 [Diphasiastrum complanatum]KAJ7554117.1 hypothetical protein O6H91_06G125700 [Diphasiastrum complanatum]
MAAYWQASSPFSPLFVESQNSFTETDTHVGEINGIPVSRLPYSTHDEGSDCFRIHSLQALRSEGERKVFQNSFAQRDSRGGVYKQYGPSGILDIFIQQACGINNICIYGEQDVYARFSISHSVDKALCSRIVEGGGKNPVFNQNLQIAVENLDSFLKCEILMASRVSYLDDQLLGFVSVPLSSLAGKGRHSQEYALSATDLCHSHAGIVNLTLMYHEKRNPLMGTQMLQMGNGVGGHSQLEASALGDSDMTSDISTLSFTCCQIEKLSVSDYTNVAFPNIQAVCEDQQLISDYLGMASNECARAKENGVTVGSPFLPQFHSVPLDQVHYDETNTDTEKRNEASVLADDCQLFNFGDMPDPSGVSCPNAGISEAHKNITALSNVHVPLKKQMVVSSSPDSVAFSVSPSLQTASTMSISEEFSAGFPADITLMDGGGSCITQKGNIQGSLNAPLLSIPAELESSKVMQQQIVDMYMKSMQQFSDPLTRMQHSMDLDRQVKLESTTSPSGRDTGESGKKLAHRVFYGSRAFF